MDHGEHPGQPQRPPASAHLMIDSLDRTRFNFSINNAQPASTSNPGNDFRITAQQPFLYGYFTRLAITQVYLKYRVPTILADNSGTGVIGNNTFVISDLSSSTTLTVSLPQGYYDATSLAAAMQTAIQGLGVPFNTYTAVWNDVSKSIKVQSNNGGGFVFQPAIGSSAAALNRLKCHNVLGITYLNGPTLGGGSPSPIQILSPPRLTWTSFVDICSSRLTKFQRVKDGETGTNQPSRGVTYNPQGNIIARVYLVAPNTRVVGDDTGGVGSAPIDLVVDYNTPKHIRWSPEEAVYELDFQLFDQFGDPLPWAPNYGTEFNLTCVASET